jgi:hypothetical protein
LLLALGLWRGSAGGWLGFDWLNMKHDKFAHVFGAPINLCIDTHKVTKAQTFANIPNLIANSVMSLHTQERRNSITLAIGLICKKEFYKVNIVKLGLLNTYNCQFKSCACHLYYLA